MSSSVENVSGSDSHEKTRQWLEDILQSYYTHLHKKGNECGVTKVAVALVDFDIGPGFAEGDGRLSTLSDLLSLRVRYKIGSDDDEEKTEHLLVKIPPNDKADREMAQMAQVDRREIHFYTETLPQIEDWAKSRKYDVKLAVPRCFFAKYHGQVSGEDDDDCGKLVSDAESVLVLEDMRPSGFAMKDFNGGLSLEEAMAALGKIAVIHALSWAMQETTGCPLDETWELTYRPHKAASAYKTMIEHGFPTLSEFLERQEPDGLEILSKLQALHPKAIELLYELLKPPPPPAPSCLTHMDFWCNNLLFRASSNCSSRNSNCNRMVNGSADNVECLIVDWQMMAVSRPTHDVALLLFTSLTPEIRSKHSQSLLRHYWDVFKETAFRVDVEVPFEFGVIENEYKKSQLLALLLVIGSIDLALESSGTQYRLTCALRDMAKEELI